MKKKVKTDTANKALIKQSVLVVDSNKETNQQIQDKLQGFGYDATGVFSGKNALAKIIKNPEPLLLLNYNLADMNGGELIKKLKQRKLKVHFIIMTDSLEEKKAASMIHQGACEHLIKEIGFLDILPAIIEKTLYELKMEAQLAELKKTLCQSEQKYNFVFENASIAMAILAENGTFLMINNAFAKLCGYSKKETEGKFNWKDFIFQEDIKKVDGPQNLSADSPDISLTNYEFRMVNRRGKVKDIFLTINTILKNPWQIASFLDVSSMRQTEEALRQSEKQFQSLIKNIPGIVYLCYYDEHWTMHYMVKEIEKISGYPASDFINNNVRSYASIIHPDDLFLVSQAVEEGVSNNKPYEIEYRIIRKDGDIAWVYEMGQKVSSQDNKIWLNGIIFDITEHKQIAIALDMATEEWRVTFDAIPNAVFLLNRECRIMKCNLAAETLLGEKKDDLIGQRYCKVIDDVNEPPKKDPYMRMLKSGCQEKEVRSLGEKIVEFTLSPILSPEGEIYGSVLLIVDITDFKKAETELKNKNCFNAY